MGLGPGPGAELQRAVAGGGEPNQLGVGEIEDHHIKFWSGRAANTGDQLLLNDQAAPGAVGAAHHDGNGPVSGLLGLRQCLRQGCGGQEGWRWGVRGHRPKEGLCAASLLVLDYMLVKEYVYFP